MRTLGSTTLPLDLLIFPSFIKIHPCANTFFGKGKSRAISKIGQIIEWKRTISFAIKCTSAGQYFWNNESSSDKYPREEI